ncbi:UDP-N-acetylmuramoyl-tripeptide--D-alanyl-D-alanine ligase [Neptuniibacter halophilus]|uniref:UDP-N-acetylmuramoyl-tripeptide--D-alanyl-D- alanine ligase n=1 Tax=Neptuniibacter halophilus TaxID=651666 RepID=UPI002573B61C|nr:UDP-N-acetylmuramoyl-tripeptide--D-alanyl-D-alanine ligase [Neptuniibacter halophilus]
MIGQWNLAQLQTQFGGELTQDCAFTGVSTDTRSLQPGDLFVALVGPNFDGHNFIQQALDKGAVAAVVSRPLEQADLPQWLVEDTLIALGQLALSNRQRFTGPVYAVTGSSGKTTVKEMLRSILAQHQQVLATRGNLNNEIGVPLTLLELSDSDQVAVIEQGASGAGEIAYTTSLSLPQVAILNNAMGAHLEGFGSLQGVVEAKAEIYSQLAKTEGTAVINLDDPHAEYWLKTTAGVRQTGFSTEYPEADLRASHIETADNGCYSFLLHRGEENRPVRLQVMGKHNVANALAAAAAVSARGMPLEQIVSGLEAFTAVAGRMKPLKAAGAVVIDDSYNANPGSVAAAMDLLVSLPGESVLVLGDMAELGEDAQAQHEKVGCRAAQKGVGRFWATGALSRHSVSAYQSESAGEGRHFETREELINALREVAGPGVNILVKGSRSAAMDQVVAGLTKGEEE